MFAIRNIAMRGARAAVITRRVQRPFSARTTAFASSDYGSPEGDPIASNPQEQGKNPKVDQEHPGPPPPSAASGSSSSGSAPSSDSKGGASPKIHDEPQPNNDSAEVKKHNEDVANRNAKQTETGEEKVDSKFWKGHGDDKPQ